MLICSKDGWTDNWEEAAPKLWNCKGVRKYQKIQIYCLSDENELQIAYPVTPNLSILNRIFWPLFNFSMTVEVEFQKQAGDPVHIFKNVLKEALESDDDILTQYRGRKELRKAIESANGYSDFYEIYRKNRWI